MPTADQILDAAADVCAQFGFKGATTRRIAQAAGVNEVTLFRRFGSKDALLAAALERMAHTPVPQLPESPARPRAELMQWAREQLDLLVTRRAHIRACLAEAEQRPDAARYALTTASAAHAELIRYLRAATAGSQPSDRLVAAASMLISSLFAGAIAGDLGPSRFRTDDVSVSSFVAFVCDALGLRDETTVAPAAAPPPYEPDATGA